MYDSVSSRYLSVGLTVAGSPTSGGVAEKAVTKSAGSGMSLTTLLIVGVGVSRWLSWGSSSSAAVAACRLVPDRSPVRASAPRLGRADAAAVCCLRGGRLAHRHRPGRPFPPTGGGCRRGASAGGRRLNAPISGLTSYEARSQLAAIIDRARAEHQPVYLARRGRPVAAVIDVGMMAWSLDVIGR